jgi:hypothetical protein
MRRKGNKLNNNIYDVTLRTRECVNRYSSYIVLHAIGRGHTKEIGNRNAVSSISTAPFGNMNSTQADNAEDTPRKLATAISLTCNMYSAQPDNSSQKIQ